MAEMVKLVRRSMVEVWWLGTGYRRRWCEPGEPVLVLSGPTVRTRIFSERQWFALFPPPWDGEGE